MSFGLSIADVDHDGDNDVFFPQYGTYAPSRLYINSGDGQFTLSDEDFEVPGVGYVASHDGALANLNGDLYPDVVLINHHTPSRVFLNDGSGGFEATDQDLVASTNNPLFVQVIDVDLDNDLDILIISTRANSHIWFNDGNGFFTQSETGYGGADAAMLHLADFTGDGYPDMYIDMLSSSSQVWINDGTGNFNYSGIDRDSGGAAISSGDLDGDGDTDLVVGGYEEVYIRLNHENSGTFTAGGTIPVGSQRTALLDVESDGDLDLIITGVENGNYLWINDWNGSFTHQESVFGTSVSYSVGCADLDGDDDPDVVFGKLEGSGGNYLYFNESQSHVDNENGTIINSCFRIYKNYPNPFNPSTAISFEIESEDNIALHIYNITGQEIVVQDMGYFGPGYHNIVWNGLNQAGQPVPTGTYICQMKADNQTSNSIKLHLMK